MLSLDTQATSISKQQTPMRMDNWIECLDVILQLNSRELLTHTGKISQQQAKDKTS